MALYVPKWVKYPKLFTLFLTFVVAYLAVSHSALEPVREFMVGLGYFGTFLAGMMYVYGFTAAPGTAALLLLAKSQNIYLAAIVAGFGAVIGDLVIYKIIKQSFSDELVTFAKEWWVIRIISLIPQQLLKYVLPVLGAIVIASPLPDEIGVMLLAAANNITDRQFTVISFLLNTAGILIVLWIGSGI